MTFSRFYNHSILFFLLFLIANTARPIGFKDSACNLGQPLFFEIPRIPQAATYAYTSILSDKDNRLFITNDHDVYIYDGLNTQQVKVNGKPVLAYNGHDKIIIAGYNYLSLLTYNPSGGYTNNQLIDSVSNSFQHQITSIGFDDSKNIYLCTGTKLWKYNEKPIIIDSSNHTITIYSTTKGLVFHSIEKGFYCLNGNKLQSFFELQRHILPDEKVFKVMVAGSYLFITTSSNRLLMLDSQGNLIKIINDFGEYYFDLPVDICSSNDIDFFAITPNQIFRFVNPMLVEIFNKNDNIKGAVRSTRFLDGNLYIATSYGIYVSKFFELKASFSLLKQGDFNELYSFNNQLFACGPNGLFRISNYQVDRIKHDFRDFQKTCIFDSKQPKVFSLNPEGVYFTILNQPSSFKKLNTNKSQIYTNIYTIDSTILFKTSDNKWYTFDSKTNNIVDQEPLELIGSNPQVVINNDTLCLINNKLAKKGILGYIGVFGVTYSNQTISSPINGLNSDFQSFYFHKSKGLGANNLADIAIEKKVTVNEVYLDSDSTSWLSTNSGLIRISYDYTKHVKSQKPSLMIFSTPINHNGFIELTSNSITDFRIKQGDPIEIHLSGIGAQAWNNLTYSYRLEGKNDEWSNWSSGSKFLLNGLKSGYYSYLFKARDAYGIESAELEINVTIIPAFFKTSFNLVAIIILIILVIYSISQWRILYFAQERFKLESIINRRTEELVKEKEKTDNLLARVLPKETATELKETGKVATQIFKMATVLFSDIQGFTKITDELNPENLIDQLDKFFLYFDSVVDKYRIEKIKTIGDAYMCAGGIPHKNRTNPIEVVLAALEMLSFMREINLEHNPGQDIWDLRIGIDTGQVIAGVVGRNKLSYDIWGTTVNTASRMESSGEVGRINISGNTHIFVQDYFLCTYRGKMPIKNKGDIEMYFVDGIKPVLSNNLDLYRPNIDFHIQLQFLRFGDLEEFILEKLEKGLPKNLYYHNLKHTVDVYTQVELIGRSEEVSLEEQLILQTAALFHDAGHLIDYDTHEEMGVKLAREILPEYQYTERQIEIISDLIMVTKLPPKPKNLLEAIMCDADLDYLGRTDFIPVSNMLYKELHEHGRIGTIQEWNELQIKFIEKHQYFTNTARKLRNVNKNSQLENIKDWIEKNKL